MAQLGLSRQSDVTKAGRLLLNCSGDAHLFVLEAMARGKSSGARRDFGFPTASAENPIHPWCRGSSKAATPSTS